jgi:hypothetical protein
VIRGIQVLKDHKVFRVSKETKEILAIQVQWDLKVHKD